MHRRALHKERNTKRHFGIVLCISQAVRKIAADN